MRGILALALVTIALPVAVPAAAQSDTHAREVSMRHRLRVDPDDAMTMANLARHYARTGRPERAQRLYRGMLGLDDVTLDRAGGPAVSSHWLATQALKSASRPRSLQLTARRN